MQSSPFPGQRLQPAQPRRRTVRTRRTSHSSGGPLVRSVLSSEHLKNSACPYFIEGAHSCYRADVVGDGDEGGSGQVLLTDRLSLLLAHHVPKAGRERKRPDAEPKATQTTELTRSSTNVNVTLRATLFKSSNFLFQNNRASAQRETDPEASPQPSR